MGNTDDTMTVLTETIINLYAMADADIAQLEAALYEQLSLAYLEQLRTLAVQHGVTNPTVGLGASEAARLQAKAHEDAVSIANTYNNDLRNQVNAIFTRNPNATREEVIGVLASWGHNRSEYKSIQIGIAVIMFAAAFGFDLFITHNNLQYQLFRAVGGIPKCPDCAFIVGAGIVTYAFTQLYQLPFHPYCSHEYTVINATDISARGNVVWLGDYARAA